MIDLTVSGTLRGVCVMFNLVVLGDVVWCMCYDQLNCVGDVAWCMCYDQLNCLGGPSVVYVS